MQRQDRGVKMKDNYVFIGRWYYEKPNLSPDKEGKIVLISEKSFGPLEIFEWGLDRSGAPYELYQWLEDDFYENDNYCRTITKEELLKQIDRVISLFEKNGLSDWVDLYRELIAGWNLF